MPRRVPTQKAQALVLDTTAAISSRPSTLHTEFPRMDVVRQFEERPERVWPLQSQLSDVVQLGTSQAC